MEKSCWEWSFDSHAFEASANAAREQHFLSVQRSPATTDLATGQLLPSEIIKIMFSCFVQVTNILPSPKIVQKVAIIFPTPGKYHLTATLVQRMINKIGKNSHPTAPAFCKTSVKWYHRHRCKSAFGVFLLEERTVLTFPYISYSTF